MASKSDLQLADEVARFYADPLGWVLFAFDWDNDPSLQVCKLPEPYSLVYDSEWGPDLWACELLERIGTKVRANAFDGRHPVSAVREAVVSGHGIGKSAMTAWLVTWIMSTRPFAHGTITANTADQLSAKTWAEVAKWNKRSITGHWFDVSTGKGAMRMKHVDHPEDWFCAAQTCREENSEAFAGQHAATSTSFYIFDEASAVPDVIQEVANGGLTDGEPMMFAFGNGTRNTGWFKDCFGKDAHRWGRTHVDSRTVQITNKQFLQEEIDDHGLDSDRVKVRVRGMFPSQSVAQFISEKDALAAYDRQLRREQYEFAPVILTCDPAWEGDDELVIGKRQGLKSEILRTIAKNDNDVQVAALLAQLEDEHQADAVMVDAGYGTGIVSAGKTMGRDWHLVWFSGESPDPGCLNLRAYMWRELRDWLKEGGAIPPDQVLLRDLTAPETVARLDGKIQLESKKDMKRRGQASPNRADALCLSFAMPISKKEFRKSTPKEYNPIERLQSARDSIRTDYDPLASDPIESYTRR